jgi:hypothetical protein
MRGARANHDGVRLLANARQTGNPADIDQVPGACEPELQQWDERVTAGKQLRVFAILTEQRDCLIDAPGTVVFERSWIHDLAPPR